MANLLYFVSLALMLVSQLQVSDAQRYGEVDRYEPDEVYSSLNEFYSSLKLQCNRYLTARNTLEALIEPTYEQSLYRGAPVTKILAQDVAYADQRIIGGIVSVGVFEDKLDRASWLLKELVIKASKEYIKSKPGKEDFVIDAKRLRILYACGRVEHLTKLIISFSFNSKADKEMCRIYSEWYAEKARRAAKPREKIGSKVKRILGRGKDKALNGAEKVESEVDDILKGVGSIGSKMPDDKMWLLASSIVWVWPVLAIAIPASTVKMSFILTRTPYKLTRSLYRFMKPKRHSYDEKYTIHPIN